MANYYTHFSVVLPLNKQQQDYAIQVANPKVIAVGNLFVLVHAWQPERQTAVGLDLLGVHLVHIERRIAYHDAGVLLGLLFCPPQFADQLAAGFEFRIGAHNINQWCCCKTIRLICGKYGGGECPRYASKVCGRTIDKWSSR